MIRYLYLTDRKRLYPIYHIVKINIDNNIKDNKLVLIYNINIKKVQLGVIQRVINKKAHVLILRTEEILYTTKFEGFELNKLIEKDISNEVLKLSIVIESLEDYITIVEGLSSDSKILFRGQSNKKWGLQPSLYREKYNSNKEIEIYNNYKKYNCDNEKAMNTIINMQHAGIPTRLLDWTINPLSALFFSVSDLNEIDNDSKVYCINADNICCFNSKEYSDIEKIVDRELELNINNNDELKNEIINILKPIALGKKSEFVFIETPFYNERIKAQQGFFSIFMEIKERYITLIREDILIKILGNEPDLIEELKNQNLNAIDIDNLMKYIEIKSNNRAMSNEKKEKIREEIIKSNVMNITTTNIEKNEFRIRENCIDIIIAATSKKTILKELDNININFKSIYPDIEGFSLYTKYQYNKNI